MNIQQFENHESGASVRQKILGNFDALAAKADEFDISLGVQAQELKDFAARRDNPNQVTAEQTKAVPESSRNQPNGFVGLDALGRIMELLAVVARHLSVTESANIDGWLNVTGGIQSESRMLIGGLETTDEFEGDGNAVFKKDVTVHEALNALGDIIASGRTIVQEPHHPDDAARLYDLQEIEARINAKIAAILKDLSWQGSYDAANNIPALPNIPTMARQYWIVKAAGTFAPLNITLNVQDILVATNDLQWDVIPASAADAALLAHINSLTAHTPQAVGAAPARPVVTQPQAEAGTLNTVVDWTPELQRAAVLSNANMPDGTLLPAGSRRNFPTRFLPGAAVNINSILIDGFYQFTETVASGDMPPGVSYFDISSLLVMGGWSATIYSPMTRSRNVRQILFAADNGMFSRHGIFGDSGITWTPWQTVATLDDIPDVANLISQITAESIGAVPESSRNQPNGFVGIQANGDVNVARNISAEEINTREGIFVRGDSAFNSDVEVGGNVRLMMRATDPSHATSLLDLTTAIAEVVAAKHNKDIWDADTNTPTLPPVPVVPDMDDSYWIVTVPGTQFGMTFEIGDWLLSINGAWKKIPVATALRNIINMHINATSGAHTPQAVGAAPANVTLADNAGANILPPTTSTAIGDILQTVRNGLRWLFERFNTLGHALRAVTADTLTTARNINSVPFDGSKDITIPVGDANLALISQTDAEAGTQETPAGWSSLRVRQAASAAAGAYRFIIRISFDSSMTGREFVVSSADFTYTGIVPPSLVMEVSVPIGGVTYMVWVDNYRRAVNVGTHFGIYTIRIDAIEFDLHNLTWAQIAGIINAGNAQDYWSIGDEKDIQLIGPLAGEVLTLQIYGFDHDDLADGSGKAPISFGLARLMADLGRMNPTNTTAGGFINTEMYGWMLGVLWESLPLDLRSIIKSVNKAFAMSSAAPFVNIAPMDIFLFAPIELGVSGTEPMLQFDGEPYSIFTDNQSRIRRLPNGVAREWWLRSIAPSFPTVRFMTILGSGVAGGSGAAANTTTSNGINFGFCI